MKEAFWIIDQLIAQGIDHFCIAPGSRSTPLVIAAAEHPKAKSIVHYDERGLGFYALGVGKGRKRPAAVITTSGSAVGNLFPSIMEAFHSHTPLILLTADRPPELRDCGANQTCDQIKLFPNYLRWQADLPPELNESYFRSIVAQAVFHAECNFPGPVQLNCQFREPLYRPSSFMPSGSALLFPSTQTVPEPLHTQASRGLILIGNLPYSPLPILELAKRLNWPVFADILSNARNFSTPEQIRHFDWILKTGAELSPDFVLHFGERLTSKKVLDLPVSLHVSPYSDLQDPTRSLSSRITCDIAPFCERFSADLADPDWLSLWQKKDREIDSTIEEFFTSTRPFTEAHAIRYLSKIVPETHAVFLGNSMPIRDSDHFLFPEKCLGFFGSRGLSGIDGNIATVAGLCDGLDAPVIAVLGDQTCLHDLNSLPLLKQAKHPITLIISNNFGGGIFSHLPIENWPRFETFVAAAHSFRFEEAAKMFDIPYFSADNISFSQTAIIELNTEREENCRFQEELFKEIKSTASRLHHVAGKNCLL